MTLEERRAKALRALALRSGGESTGIPETRPSGDMPEYAEAAALFLSKRYSEDEDEEDDEWWIDHPSGSS